MIFETVFADERELAAEWKGEAQRRRAIWPEDPVAAMFAFCAAELEDRVRRQELRTAHLTVAEYAGMHRVSEPTVRRWIKQGLIPATRTSDGYVVARDVEAPRASRRARVAA